MVLIFAEELDKGVVNPDLHIKNVIVLEHEPDEFVLNSSVKCKKVKMIDLGFLYRVKNFEYAVVKLVYRVVMNTQGIDVIPDEILQLVVKLVSPGEAEAKNILASLKYHPQAGEFASAVLSALNTH